MLMTVMAMIMVLMLFINNTSNAEDCRSVHHIDVFHCRVRGHRYFNGNNIKHVVLISLTLLVTYLHASRV